MAGRSADGVVESMQLKPAAARLLPFLLSAVSSGTIGGPPPGTSRHFTAFAKGLRGPVEEIIL